MKPTLENIRKMATETNDLGILSILRDHVAFYISGAKEAALELGKSMEAPWDVLDKARGIEGFISFRIRSIRIAERPRGRSRVSEE